jgi:sterol desaturase/sphingolipid hydroxylase (fatty acid hydroxylase superfamily)
LPALLDPQHLLAFLKELARLCTWLLLLALIFLPLERLFALHPQKLFRKALAQDLGYYFISSLVPGLLFAVPLSLVAVGAHAIVPYRLQAAVAAWPLWQRILVGFVVGEVGFYWGHRWTHEIPFLWRFHAIHHSAEHVYFLTSARAHPIDSAFTRLCGLVPACVLGVASPLTPTGSVVPALVMLVATTWGFFIHANMRWRLWPLEWVISTPAFHHWHHTLADHKDRNFASMLPWMDRIFGTYYMPRKQWPSAYGIEAKLPLSIARQLAYPFRSLWFSNTLPRRAAPSASISADPSGGRHTEPRHPVEVAIIRRPITRHPSRNLLPADSLGDETALQRAAFEVVLRRQRACRRPGTSARDW